MLAVNPSGAGTPFSTMKVLPLEVMIAFGMLRKFPNFGDGSRSTPHRDRVIGALGLKVPPMLLARAVEVIEYNRDLPTRNVSCWHH